MYKHILIATDGSDLASRGVEHGLAIAAALGARVTVLSVGEPLDTRVAHAAAVAGVRDVVTQHEASVRRMLQDSFAKVQAQADAQGVTAELVSQISPFPAEAIVQHADANGCDLIVMSSHGRRGIAKLILGSQTSEVLTHTSIPVLVVR